MSDFDISVIYSLIEKKFCLSKDEIEELDTKDGIKDARLNGISLFHLLKKGVEQNKIQIENKESFKNYSVFLTDNSQVDIYDMQKNPNVCVNEFYGNSTTNNIDIDNISSMTPKQQEAYNIAKNIIKQIFKFGIANLDSPISEINETNVVEVIQIYQKLSDKKNTNVFGILTDKESIFEAILDEAALSDDQKKKYINHIKDALIKRINNLNGDSTLTGQLFSNALDTAINKWWPFQNSDRLDELCNKFIEIIQQLETMQKAGEAITPAKAKKINQGFVNELEQMGLSIQDILGNGMFDNDSVQEGGNCWIHAGINAMRTSPESKEYLNNLVHKSPNGNIVVYLPGAKDDALPKPKGDGIYVFTERQISDALQEESAGDGEYTALCLAIRNYRRESTGNNNADNTGGTFEEFCKLIYGKDASTFVFSNRHEEKDRAKQAKEELDSLKKYMTDTQIELREIISCMDSFENMYKNLKQAFDSKKYIFKVSISAANYYRILDNQPVVPDDNAGHALAVIAMTDSYVLLKDSNNPKDKPIKINVNDFLKTCTVEGFKVG